MNDSANPSKAFFIFGSASAGIAVAAGAFGAHGLKNTLPGEMLAIFETAVRYQMYHSLALVATGWALNGWNGEKSAGFKIAGWSFIIGIILFSGSLYALSLTGVGMLGAITPLGGVAFITGWLMLAWSARKSKAP